MGAAIRFEKKLDVDPDTLRNTEVNRTSFLEEFSTEDCADDEHPFCLVSVEDREHDNIHNSVVKFDDSMGSLNNNVPERNRFKNIDHLSGQSCALCELGSQCATRKFRFGHGIKEGENRYSFFLNTQTSVRWKIKNL